MPTEAVVTEEQVIAAGRGLVARGKRVTGHTIRQIIGAGDPKRLAAIWEADGAANAPPPPVVLPGEFEDLAAAEAERVTAGVHHLVISLWQSADRLAGEGVKAAVASLQERLAEQTVDLEAAGESLVKAETERDAAAAETNRRGDVIIDFERRLAAANARLEQLQNEILAAEHRAQDAVAEAQRTGTQCRQDIERLQALLTDAERRAGAAEGRLEQAADSAAALDERARAAEAAARRAEQEARSALIAQAAAEGERNATLARATAAEERLERETGTMTGKGSARRSQKPGPLE